MFGEYVPRKPYYRDVYRITMMSKTGRKLYFTVDQVFGLNKDGSYRRSYKWQPMKLGSMEFKNEKEAKDFAEGYFKNFHNYEIDYSEEYDGCI